MSSGGSQFILLMWKNWLLQTRSVLLTIVEIGLPTSLALLLLGLKQLVDPIYHTEPLLWRSYSIDQLPDDLDPWSSVGLNGTNSQWLLAYTPNVAVTERLMWSVGSKLDMKVDGMGFASEEKMLEFFSAENATTMDTWGGIVFNSELAASSVEQLSKDIWYTIRPKAEQYFGRNSRVRFTSASDWKSTYVYPEFQYLGPRQRDEYDGGQPGYNREGFLAIQKALDEAIILEHAPNASVEDIALEMKRHPYPPYLEDYFIYALMYNLPFIIMLSFIILAPNIVKDIVLEKERKLRESMKMMGLKTWVNWVAWFTKYFIFTFITVSIMTLFFHIDAGKGAVLGNSDPSLTFVFLLLYCIATIFFCFAISTFFSKASSGAAAGAILFLATYLPYFFIQYRYADVSYGVKVGVSIFHNVAMAFGCVQYAMYEARGTGLRWDNFYEPINASDQFTMLHVMVFLVVDSVLYALITWYVDAVKPGEYGLPQPFYFPFTKTYWCGSSGVVIDVDVEKGDKYLESEFFEAKPVDLKSGIALRNLTKEFKMGNTKKKAVDGVYLDMYEGQISALLGHNGAGKTTTMFMLTGFIPPTSGTAYVNGYDIRTDIKHVRSSLGLCPQHDVLFDTLTVQEHLTFFAKLKGYPKAQVPLEVARMIEVLHLEDKTYAQSKTLSGGMKRKLSVGIALCADSKVVILDEPTSGMDPEARRQTWDIIQGQRQGRTMLLTTHFMDEADFLGDRIAIMAEGVVQCCGSSLFLKGKYGVGYHMVIVKEPHCNVQKVTCEIQKYVPEAQMESNVSAELSYKLPHESSNRFEDLFNYLEKSRQELGIASYGASVTTMEEVFLKVGQTVDESLEERLQQTEEMLSSDMAASNGHVASNGDVLSQNDAVNGIENAAFTESQTGIPQENKRTEPNQEKNKGMTLQLQQFRAMFEKRVIHSWRNRLLTFVQLILPFCFTLIACLVLETFPGPRDPPAMNIILDHYEKPVAPYAINNTFNETDFAYELALAYKSFMDSQSVYVDAPFINEIGEYEDNPNMDSYLGKEGDDDFDAYSRYYMTAVTFEEDRDPDLYNESILVTAHFNNEAYHTSAAALSMVNNAILQAFAGSDFSIKITNHPLPRETTAVVEEEIETSNAMAFVVAYNIAFGMAFLVGSFILFLIKERVSKSKHIQFASGVNAFNFWMSTFSWDLINYLIPAFLLYPLFAIFSLEAYIDGVNAGYTTLVFLFYALSILPITYVMSFLFEVPSSGYVWVTVLNIFLGTAAMLTVEILLYPELDLVEIGEALEWLFYIILPPFSFSRSLQDLFLNHQTLKACYGQVEGLGISLETLCSGFAFVNMTNACCKDNCGDYCQNFEDNYLAWTSPGIGRGICFMGVQSLVAFFTLFFLESGTWKSIWQTIVAGTISHETEVEEDIAMSPVGHSQIGEDADVTAERNRILNTPLAVLQSTDRLIISELQKYYGAFLAVDKLSFGVPEGECFGLLGVNGAGKTTTFKMLTGDEAVSSGNAWLDGFSVNSQIKQAQERMGYCPQFDAVIDQMTVKETLRMYGRLRGVKEDLLPGVVDGLINSLLLQAHSDKRAGNLSGGNKRKLNTAIALIGDPPIVFLDEPTTGMDPVARRLLWDTLTKVRATGRTLILTSHSMEECEALCTRIAIMVNGQFKCLGSTQHLKNKFGEGYTLMAKVAPPEGSDVETTTKELMTYIENTFPGSILKDLHQGYVHYQIKSDELGWAEVFGTMERAKEEYHIEDYSVSQTTLEQVFINFARAQMPPTMTNQTCAMKSKNCLKYFCCCGCCKSNSVFPDR